MPEKAANSAIRMQITLSFHLKNKTIIFTKLFESPRSRVAR